MNNPISTAIRGKGLHQFLFRITSIFKRYSFDSSKMGKSLDLLIQILNEFEAKATLPVTASALDRHIKLALKLQSSEIELAIHGYQHIDYSQIPINQQEDHLERAKRIFGKVGIKNLGFRSPYLRWNVELMKALSKGDIKYDSSQAIAWDFTNIEMSDTYKHVLEFYGAKNARGYPSLPRFLKGIVQIPYSLPDDEALVERLGLSGSEKMTEIWLSILDRVYHSGELFTIGLHPERVSECEKPLRATLKKAKSYEPHVWFARLDEITDWYQELGKTIFTIDPLSGGKNKIQILAPPEAVLLGRSVDIKEPVKPWNHTYYQILSNEIEIPNKIRPWIGLSPNCPQNLKQFLKHLGYLVEINDDPTNFSYFYQLSTFNPEDERVLLSELEDSDKPLIKLGRWPGGAQAALSVTGDLDAFTLIDYAFRFNNR